MIHEARPHSRLPQLPGLMDPFGLPRSRFPTVFPSRPGGRARLTFTGYVYFNLTTISNQASTQRCLRLRFHEDSEPYHPRGFPPCEPGASVNRYIRTSRDPGQRPKGPRSVQSEMSPVPRLVIIIHKPATQPGISSEHSITLV